ncbi:hypothetical protein JCM3774_005340 [Rhodotorula dairenensis]
MSSSISGTDRPPPNMPHATQVVPSLGLNGRPTTTPAPSEDNGGDTFPLAAIAMLAIVVGIAGLVFAYKLYRWCYLRAQRAQAIEDFYGPETRGGLHQRSPGPGGGFASLPSQISLGPGVTTGGFDSMGRRSMSGFAGARHRQMSWGGDSWGGGGTQGGKEKGLIADGDFSPPQQAGSREASPGPYDASSRASIGGFPSSYSSRNSLGGPPPRRGIYSSSASGSQILSPTRTMSSFSSPYLAPSPSSAPQPQQFPSGNRLAGAPHSIHSRIEVVPPAPLAPPPGQVVATDTSTLDFAPGSGIGRGNSVFAPTSMALGPTAPPVMASSSGSGGGNQNSDEWDLVSSDEAQERLAFDTPSPYSASAAPSLSPIIPASSSSSLSTSSMSQSDPRVHHQNQPIAPRATMAGPSSGVATATPSAHYATNPDPGQSLSLADVPLSPPFVHPDPGATHSSLRDHPYHHPRLPSIDTGGAFVPPAAVSRLVGEAAASGHGTDEDEDGAAGPRSPLEKLQMQVERERRSLSLRQELTREDDDDDGNYGHHRA